MTCPVAGWQFSESLYRWNPEDLKPHVELSYHNKGSTEKGCFNDKVLRSAAPDLMALVWC